MYGHSSEIVRCSGIARSAASWRRIAASRSTSSGPGSMPSCSTSRRRAPCSERNASACRPQRYCARARMAHRRSRSGFSATSASARAATMRWSPLMRCASSRSSSSDRRSSSSRVRSPMAGGQPSRSSKGVPRQVAAARSKVAAARSGSPTCMRACPRATRRSNSTMSTETPSAARRYPPPTVSMAAEPSALRNRATQICTCLAHDGGGASPHTASATWAAVTTDPRRAPSAASTRRSRGRNVSSPSTRTGPSRRIPTPEE